MKILKRTILVVLSMVFVLTITYFTVNTKIIKFKVLETNKTSRTLKFKKKFLKEPKIKLDNNLEIEGWYLDKDFKDEWLFDVNKVRRNQTLYAKVLKTIDVNLYRDNNLVLDYMYEEFNEYDPMRLGYKFKGLYLDENYTDKLSDYPNELKSGIDLYEKWELEERELPVLTIDILDGTKLEDVDKENYLDSNLNLFNTEEEYELKDTLAEFRGRGNSSWFGFDKKGFKIKFDKKQGLFGQAKNKHWVLVAEGYDTSLTKNKVAYTLGNKVFTNIEYSTKAHYLDVYINGDYHGIYLLLEHKRVGKGRVYIESEFNELDTGYLLEYDAYANRDNDNVDGIDYFKVKGLRHPFLVKSPKPGNYEKNGMTEEEFREQMLFIKSYMDDAFDAMYNGTKEEIENYFDIDSFVDMYILQEFVKNYDSGWSSQYIYKKTGGKLYFGPPWDFDISAGSTYRPGLSKPTGIYVGSNWTLQFPKHKSQMYITMMKKDWFKELVVERILNLEDNIRLEIKNIYNDVYSYEKSFELNYFRWPEYTKANIDPKNYLLEQEKTEKWYYDRLDWLVNWAKKEK